MTIDVIPPGYVWALVERRADKHGLLAEASEATDDRQVGKIMREYHRENESDGLIIDRSYSPVPIGGGLEADFSTNLEAILHPEKSDKFLVSGIVDTRGGDGTRELLIDGEPVHSDPPISGLLNPCPPTCGTSQAVGNTHTVRHNLNVHALRAHGLDGSGVAIAIVDSGIYLPRIQRLLGDAMNPATTTVYFDAAHSWRPSGLGTRPGYHRVGHGTMCAYDALIAAPKATLLDIPMLLARPVADHRVPVTVKYAIKAYKYLIKTWKSPNKPFDALVVSNSWGIFHPSMDMYPPNSPRRFIDNKNHIFRMFVQMLAQSKVDVVFCGNNCGNDANCAGACASGTCLSKTDRMIMGANAYEEVLTVGGCDTNDRMVGYSSRGPSIAGMYQNKPDLVAYTHFLGSKAVAPWVPDTGVSAACPVAAGCVAALRTKAKPASTTPAQLFDTLRNTARKPGGGPAGWQPDFGYGIIDPVAAAQALQII